MQYAETGINVATFGTLTFTAGKISDASILGNVSLISGIEGNRNSNNNSHSLNNTYIVSNNNKYVNLASNERTKHVLYGDKTGGGHMWPGLNKKTSFPKSWNTDKIMNELSDISTDPSLK